MIFSNQRLIIDLATFEDKQKVFEFLNKTSSKKINSTCYEIQGSFEELERVFYNISSIRSDARSVKTQDNTDYPNVTKKQAKTHNLDLALPQQNTFIDRRIDRSHRNHEDLLRDEKGMSPVLVGERKLQSQGTYGDIPGPSAELRKEPRGVEETCPICLDSMQKAKMETLSSCHHSFCKDCLNKAFSSKPVCPVCGVVYGRLKGNQPENGTMNVSVSQTSLPGNERYGTIVIQYCIPSGIQGEDHPNPGQQYEGVSRVAFLPDSAKGRKVLSLLQRAFEQRLIFTVGRSSTTGRSNVVTWNDIHHKTSREGGPTSFGYPDPDYLRRVQEELKAKGID